MRSNSELLKSTMKIYTASFISCLLPPLIILQNVKGNVRGQSSSDVREIAETYRNSRSTLAEEVKVIERGRARLACNLAPSNSADRINVIAWYKGSEDPIYSYDQRQYPPKTWKNTSLPFRHLSFTFEKPATLILSNVMETDDSYYVCMIDYGISPTMKQLILLRVIVPPKQLSIIDDKGRELSSTAGPYDEGAFMILKCVVIGGKPASEIVWLRNEIPTVSGRYSGSSKSQILNTQLTRSNLRDSFTCRASNNNSTLPLRKTVKVKMNLPPLSVKILTSKPLSARKRQEIVCLTYGSKPPSKIIWLFNNQIVDSGRFTVDQIDSVDGNSSSSALSFTPTRSDHGVLLRCRATNPHLQFRGLEDSVTLNVTYIPKTTINLGKLVKAEYIQEGHDAYLECEIDANPASTKLMWFHNGRLLKDNRKNDISIINNDLVLRNITKYQNGNYSCVASNEEGEGESNTFNLSIMYRPVCKVNQPRVYGVARRELAKVLCEVESYPAPHNFTWSFNNSAETLDIVQTRKLFSSNKFLSAVTYKPINELDYGTLLCWAINAAGKQSEPCVFHIVPAGKPDRPFNCTILNASSFSLEVQCQEGFDGGLPQTAQVVVYDQVTSVLLANISSTFPVLVVDNLEAGKLLKLEIFAVNSKGRSEPFSLAGYTLIDAKKSSVLSMDVQRRMEIIPVLGVIIGFVIMLVVLSVAIFIIVRLRICKLRRNSPVFSVDNSKVNLSTQKRPNGRDFLEKDENNPDIIPIYTNLQQSSSNSKESPHQESIFTPLTEAFLAKNREQDMYGLHYAELAPIQTDVSQHNKFLQDRDKNRVIYAEIEHNGKGASQPNQFPTGLSLGPDSSSFPLKKTSNQPESRREVVTTKAQFYGYHQESRV